MPKHFDCINDIWIFIERFYFRWDLNARMCTMELQLNDTCLCILFHFIIILSSLGCLVLDDPITVLNQCDSIHWWKFVTNHSKIFAQISYKVNDLLRWNWNRALQYRIWLWQWKMQTFQSVAFNLVVEKRRCHLLNVDVWVYIFKFYIKSLHIIIKRKETI